MIVPFREEYAHNGMFLIYNGRSIYKITKVNGDKADLISFGVLIGGRIVEHDDKMVLGGISLNNFNQAYVPSVKMK